MSKLYPQATIARKQRFNSKGFTLLELMVVMAIASILVGLAIPNLRDYVANTRITTTTDELVTVISTARTEAIKRNASVLMCKSSDVDPANPVNASCDSMMEDNWHQGWLLYAAPASNTPAPFVTGAGGPTDTTPLILANNSAGSGVTIISNSAGSGFLHFDQRGFLRNSDMIVLAICDDRGEDSGRIIEVSRLGRTSVYKTNTTDTLRACSPS